MDSLGTPRRARPLAYLFSGKWSWVALIAALLLAIYSGHFADMGIPIPLDRVAIAATLVGIVAEALHDRSAAVVRAPCALAAQLVLLVMALASAIWSGTILDTVPFYAILDRLLLPALLFAVAGVAVRSDRHRLWFARAMVVLGVYLGLTSVASVLRLDGLVWPSYIMNPAVGIHFGRARGPFVESAANGFALIYCYVMAIYVFTAETRAAWRVFASVVAVLCLVSSLLTYTRAIWIGVVVATVVLLVTLPAARRLTGVAGAVALIAALVTIELSPDIQTAILDRSGEGAPIDDRTNTNSTALRLVAQYPLTGIGWGRFLQTVDDNVRQLATVPITNVHIEAHNVLLARAAELGVFGGIAWLCVFLSSHVGAALRALKWQRTGSSGLGACMAAVAAAYFILAMTTPMPYPFANYASYALAGVLLQPIEMRAVS